MKNLLLCLFVLLPLQAHALKVFNLNVFDQLQGKWDADFRAKRLAAISKYIDKENPDLVIFQEARGELSGKENGGVDSEDSKLLRKKYPFRKYIHEMTGEDGGSYGYWVGAKKKPTEWIEDGFSFPGGVKRRVQAAVWKNAIGKKCLGTLSLHMSYQNTEVRQKEAEWILDWIKKNETKCKQWLVVGDFNADKEDKEIQKLFAGGLKHLYSDLKPTVGAYNAIRRIYGENVPSKTIDWAMGWNLEGKANVVLADQYEGMWVSDHAGVMIELPKK